VVSTLSEKPALIIYRTKMEAADCPETVASTTMIRLRNAIKQRRKSKPLSTVPKFRILEK
jgi:hypothetical protein